MVAASVQSIATPKKKAPQRVRMSQSQINEKFFGTKPHYTGIEFEDDSARRSALMYGLNWFANFFDNKKSLPFINGWLSKQEYFEFSKDEIERLNRNFRMFCPTYYALMQMEYNDWVLSEKEVSQIHAHLKEVCNSRLVADDDPPDQNPETGPEPKPVQPSPPRNPKRVILEKLNSTVLSELEGMYDVWMFAKTPDERKETYDLNSAIMIHGIKGAVAMNLIRDWVQEKLTELEAVKNKTDPDLVEGYSNVKPVNLSNTISKLQELLSGLTVVKANVRNISAANRKPRQAKEVSAQKLVANLKYKPQDLELGVVSVTPESIVGAKTVYLFNTRYNAITVLNSSEDDGFTVRGTTILNLDETRSFSQKLRKPNETVQFILSTSGRIKIENHLSSLTTKRSTANGRVNENVLILKTLK